MDIKVLISLICFTTTLADDCTQFSCICNLQYNEITCNAEWINTIPYELSKWGIDNLYIYGTRMQHLDYKALERYKYIELSGNYLLDCKDILNLQDKLKNTTIGGTDMEICSKDGQIIQTQSTQQGKTTQEVRESSADGTMKRESAVQTEIWKSTTQMEEIYSTIKIDREQDMENKSTEKQQGIMKMWETTEAYSLSTMQTETNKEDHTIRGSNRTAQALIDNKEKKGEICLPSL